MRRTFAPIAAALALSGCVATPDPAGVDPIAAALSGRTLVNDGARIEVNPDGTLSGFVEGTWSVENGQWCRTLTAPARVAGSACQDIEIADGQATIDGVNGPVTWDIL